MDQLRSQKVVACQLRESEGPVPGCGLAIKNGPVALMWAGDKVLGNPLADVLRRTPSRPVVEEIRLGSKRDSPSQQHARNKKIIKKAHDFDSPFSCIESTTRFLSGITSLPRNKKRSIIALVQLAAEFSFLHQALLPRPIDSKLSGPSGLIHLRQIPLSIPPVQRKPLDLVEIAVPPDDRGSKLNFRFQVASRRTVMGVLAWIVVGLIAGWLAGTVMKGGGYGVLVDIVLGILGGVLGGWIFGALGIWHGGGMIGSIIVAFVGAVILVWITRLLKKA
jgi:uncharacterized membrane protein YeaQ/YmgE (transglycosylase-associated protein family)